MTREEAEGYAKEMTYRDAVYNALQGKCIPYRKATLIKLYELLDKLEQEPKTGHWKCYQNDKGDWVNECSVCGLDAGVGYSYPYCPWCGAKMVGATESEEEM